MQGGPWAALLLASIVALSFLFACGDGEEPTVTPGTTEITTVRPTAETDGLAGFRQFASQIDQAIARLDGALIRDRASLTQIRCEQLNLCGPRPPGTTISGLYSGVWRTDALDLVPIEDAVGGFLGFIRGADTTQTDEFGSGGAVLYALARAEPSKAPFSPPGDVSYAILTAILRDTQGRPVRSVQIYQFLFLDNRWRLHGQIATSVLAREWLSPQCADCYTTWERWKGATSAAGIGSYDDPYDFRSFVQRLATAIETADVQFFLDNVTFTDLCTGGFPSLPAFCQKPPASVLGIGLGIWQSEGVALEVAVYEDFISDFLKEYDAAASDVYGGPKPQLYAYGGFRPGLEGEEPPGTLETVHAIVIRIVPPPIKFYPPGFGQGIPLGRSVILFGVSFNGKAWRINHMHLGLPAFLDPNSSAADEAGVKDVFRFWRRWEGATP